ncbi:MAG: fibronectin type III domain-containing protein [Actinobacteria bacterium]|nr:fibronectin type III domain-containing protein [Actinomycetota bacterium]
MSERTVLSFHRRVHADPSRSEGDRGFTLVEIVVALAILAIILTPLTMAFITMLQRQRDVNDQLSRSADAQRIGAAWTKDVQSVDKDGINVTGTCGSALGASATETQLVTFSWDTDVSAGTSKKSASWVAVGEGEDLKLVRRYCENDAPVQETRLADKIGIEGEPVVSVVHGPDLSQPRNFCPLVGGISDRCTIVVEGSFSYRLTVARRVPDRSGVVTPDTVPPPPTITGGTVARNTYITVVWTPPPSWTPPIDLFRAYAYTSPTGSPVASVEVDSLSTAADLLDLDNGTPYWVRVQSHNSVGWGDLSPAYGPLTPAPTAPDAPTITNVAVGDTDATISWTPAANDGGSAVTEWRVWATGGSTTLGPFTFGSSATSGLVTGLTNGTEYRFTVAGVNSMGEGIHAEPSLPYVPYGIPGKALITGVNTNADGSIEIAWQSPEDATPPTLPANSSVANGGRPILGYRVRIASGGSGGPWPSSSTSDLLPANSTSFTTPTLTLGTTYTFIVETWNARGHSDSDASGPALSATPPNVPGSITATASGLGTIVVTWTAPSANGSPITGYAIRATGPTTPTPQTPGAGTLTATFTGLSSGQTYTFYVRAINAIGNGPEGSRTGVPVGAPSAPINVDFRRQTGNNYPFAYSASWGRPLNTGGACIREYRVEYSIDGSHPVSPSVSTTGTPNALCGGEPALSTSITGLTAGVSTRYFRVVAINTADQVGASAWQSFQPRATCTVPAVEDTYIDEYNGLFGIGGRRGNSYGGATTLTVSKNGSRALFRFDPRPSSGSVCEDIGTRLPSAAGVESGAVSVYFIEDDSIFSTRTIELWRSGKAWTGGTSYNAYQSLSGTGEYNQSDSIPMSSSNRRYSWGVILADLMDQINGTGRNGWLLKDAGNYDPGNPFSTFRSTESSDKPYLVITFY